MYNRLVLSPARARLAAAYRADFWVWRGTFAIMVLATAVALTEIIAVRPFLSIDENAHTAYALDVSHGHLPTMSTRVQPEIPGMFRQPIYVANHPPFYYVFAGAVARLGIAAGHPIMGFFGARLVSLLFLLIALGLTCAIVRAIVPSKPALALVATGLVAVLPLSTSIAATVFNDTAALATTNLALLLSVMVVRRGAGWHRVLWLALACVAAALTRSSGLTVTVVAAVAILLASFGSRRGRQELLDATLKVGALIVAVGVGAGWFYVRNRHYYGDFSGARVALKMFPAPHIDIASSISSWHFWQTLYFGAFGRAQYLHNGYGTLLRVLCDSVFIGGIGLLVRVALAARARRALVSPDLSWRGVALLLLQAVMVVGSFFGYASHGGATFTRYLVPTLAFLGLMAAWALDALPLRRLQLAPVVALGALTWLAFELASAGLQWRNPTMVRQSVFHRLVLGMQHNGVPVPTLVTVALLLAATAAYASVSVCIVAASRVAYRTTAGSDTSALQPTNVTDTRRASTATTV